MTYNPKVTTPITTALIEATRCSDSDFTEAQYNTAGDGFMITEIYGRTVRNIFAQYNATPIDYVADLTRRGIKGQWVKATGIVDALGVMEAPQWELTGELGEAVNTLLGERIYQ